FRKAEAEALERRDREIRAADEALSRVTVQAQQGRDAASQRLAQDFGAKHAAIERRHTARVEQAQARRTKNRQAAEAAYARRTAGASAERDNLLVQAKAESASAQSQLEQRWDEGVRGLRQGIDEASGLHISKFDWHAAGDLSGWQPARGFIANVPFGWLELDLARLSPGVRARDGFPQATNGELRLPAILALPTRGS